MIKFIAFPAHLATADLVLHTVFGEIQIGHEDPAKSYSYYATTQILLDCCSGGKQDIYISDEPT